MNMPEQTRPSGENGAHRKTHSYLGSWIVRNRERILVAGIVVIVLYLAYLANYAFFHTTVEGIVVVIASAIFLLAWKSRNVIRNNYFLFLGIAFLFFAIITFLHALTAPGVAIFRNGGGPLSSQFWIAGQFMLALSLLVAPFFIRKNLWFRGAIAVFALIDLAIISSILFLNLFPATYITNVGSTPFKNASEYVISLILIGAMVVLYRNRSSFDPKVLSSLLVAFALTIITELTLTFMASSTDLFSFAGHIFRLFSFYFFYVAIIETGLQRPYDILYRELRESEEQMRIALEAADLGTWSFDLATGIAEHSFRHDQIFGYSEPVPEWSHEISIRHMLPEFHAVARDAPQQALKTGSFSFEAQVCWPDGSIHWINPYGRIQYDTEGNPVRLAGVVADITDRKNAEVALQESEERFRKIAESLPVLISLTRLEDSTILFTNTAYNDAFGFRKGELVGKSGPDVYYDPADRVKMIGILREQGSVSNYKIKAKKSNGLPILLLSSVNTILYDGKPAIIGASIDITEREQAEEALKESDLRLNLALEAGRLGWHDYRPLTGEITWDRNCRAMWGIGPDDPVNIDVFWAGIHPDSVKVTQEKLAAAIDPAGDGRFEGECLVRPLDGSPFRWIHATGLTIFEGTGAGRHPSHVIGTVQDITARKQAETALQNNIRLLEDVMEGSPSPIFLKDLEGRFISINSALERMLGKSRQELKGKTDYDIAPKELADYWQSHDKKIIETGEAIQVEETADLPDGHHTFLANKFPLVDAGGRIYGVGAISHDITERKRAQVELQATMQKFYRILSGMPYGILLINEEERVEFVNQPFCDIFGFAESPDALVNMPAREMEEKIRPVVANHEQIVSHLREVMNIGQPVIDDDIVLEGNRSFLRYYIPLRAGEKKSGRLWILIDITDRKRAEEALRNSEATLEAFFDASSGILNIEDDQFRYVKTDRTTPAYFGLDRTTIVGKSVHELAPDFIRDYGKMMRGVIETGEPVANIELQSPVPSRPGEITYWQASYFPVPLPGGRKGIGIMGVDMTDRRRAEEALKQKNMELSALNDELAFKEEKLQQNVEEISLREEDLSKALAEKEVLLSEIHHRVKNNLTAFISLLSLEGSTDDTPAGKMLRQDLQNRARSMALVHETLYRTHSYNEVDMGVYLTNLVEQIAKSFNTARAVNMVVNADGVMLDIPRATPAGLIVNELVTNSFKYAFPVSPDFSELRNSPPVISIALAKNDGEYTMTVKDNGIGLPPGFDLARTQTLGLKLVNFLGKHQMRAKIEVRSENGTEFMFRFKE